MHDAVDVAQTAYQVLHQHPADPEVRRLCTLLIGDNPVNFQRAQGSNPITLIFILYRTTTNKVFSL